MQALVNGMTDQLGAMERVVSVAYSLLHGSLGGNLADRSQTPMPYIIAVHMKQATTMLLFVLPFTLVDALSWKMVPLMFFIALIYMGEHRYKEMTEEQESRESLRRWNSRSERE